MVSGDKWLRQLSFKWKITSSSKNLRGCKLVFSAFWQLTQLKQPEWKYQGWMMLKRESLNMNWSAMWWKGQGNYAWDTKQVNLSWMHPPFFPLLFGLWNTMPILIPTSSNLEGVVSLLPRFPCHLSWPLSFCLCLSLPVSGLFLSLSLHHTLCPLPLSLPRFPS